MREKRRLERKQFKIDRAAAMLDAAKTAEAVLVTGQAPTLPNEAGGSVDADADADAREEEDETETAAIIGADVARPSSPTPSSSTTATAIDVSSLTPQTYLVRPTRPDANRNRGRKAFKRKPPAPAPAQSNVNATQAGTTEAATSARASADTLAAAPPTMPLPTVPQAEVDVDDEVDPLPEDDELEEELIGEMEHLQLSLEEAWFLSSAVGVLRIYDPATVRLPPHVLGFVSRLLLSCLVWCAPGADPYTQQAFLPPSAVLPLLLTPTSIAPTTVRPKLRPDDPFLVSYIGYHHFRALGWVVKPGIKFCADWLLYRRGPVFSHSA